MIVSGVVGIDPAEPDLVARVEVDEDRGGLRGAVGGGVPVEGRGGRAHNGTHEVESVEVRPAGIRRIGIRDGPRRADLKLEIELLGRGIAAISPLLAHKTNVERSQGNPCVVDEANRVQNVSRRPRRHRSERPFRNHSRAVTVDGARVRGPRIGPIGRRIRRSDHELRIPAEEGGIVRPWIGGPGDGQCIEVLGVWSADRGERHLCRHRRCHSRKSGGQKSGKDRTRSKGHRASGRALMGGRIRESGGQSRDQSHNLWEGRHRGLRPVLVSSFVGTK